MSSPPGYNPDASMLPGAGGASVPMLKMSGGGGDLPPEYKDGGYTQSMLNTTNVSQAPPVISMSGGQETLNGPVENESMETLNGPVENEPVEIPNDAEETSNGLKEAPSNSTNIQIGQLSITEAEFNEANNTDLTYEAFIRDITKCKTASETEGDSSCANVRSVLRQIFINRLQTYIDECQGFVATGTTAASFALQQARAMVTSKPLPTSALPQLLKPDGKGNYIAAKSGEYGAFSSSQGQFTKGPQGTFVMIGKVPSETIKAPSQVLAEGIAAIKTGEPKALTQQEKTLLTGITAFEHATQPPPPVKELTAEEETKRFKMIKIVMDLLQLLPQLKRSALGKSQIPSPNIDTYYYRNLADLIGGLNAIIGTLTIGQRTEERMKKLDFYNIPRYEPINKKVGNVFRVPDEIGQKINQFIQEHNDILNVRSLDYNNMFEDLYSNLILFLPVIGNVKIFNKIRAESTEGSVLDTLASEYNRKLGEGTFLGRQKNYISIYIKKGSSLNPPANYVISLFAWRPDIAGVFTKDLIVGEIAPGSELEKALVETQKIEFGKDSFDFLMRRLFSKQEFDGNDEKMFQALHEGLGAYDMLYNLFISPVVNPFKTEDGILGREIDFRAPPKRIDTDISPAVINMYIKTAFFGELNATKDVAEDGILASFKSLLGINGIDEKVITANDRIGLEQAFGDNTQQSFFDAVRARLAASDADVSQISIEKLNTIMDIISKQSSIPSMPQDATEEQKKAVYSQIAKAIIPLYDYIVAFYFMITEIVPETMTTKEKGVMYNNFLKQLYVGLKRTSAVPRLAILDTIETDSNKILFTKDIEDIQQYFQTALLGAAPDYVVYFSKLVFSEVFSIYDDMVTIPDVESRITAETTMYEYLLIFRDIWKYFVAKDSVIATKAPRLNTRMNGDLFMRPDFITGYKFAPMTEIVFINDCYTAMSVSKFFQNQTTTGDKKLLLDIRQKLNMEHLINNILKPIYDQFTALKDDSSFTFEYKPITYDFELERFTSREYFISHVFTLMKLLQLLKDNGSLDDNVQADLDTVLIDFYQEVFNKIWSAWTNPSLQSLMSDDSKNMIQDQLNALVSPAVGIDLSTGNRDNFIKKLFFGDPAERRDCRQLMKDMKDIITAPSIAPELANVFETVCAIDEFDIRDQFNIIRNDDNIDTQLSGYLKYSNEIIAKFAINPKNDARWATNLKAIMEHPEKEAEFLLHLKEANDNLNDPPTYADEMSLILEFLNITLGSATTVPVVEAEEQEVETGLNADEGNMGEIALEGGAKKGKKPFIPRVVAPAKTVATPAKEVTTKPDTERIGQLDVSNLPVITSTRGLRFIEYPSDILYGKPNEVERSIFMDLMLALFARLLHNIINQQAIQINVHETYINAFFFMYNQFNTLVYAIGEQDNQIFKLFNVYLSFDELRQYFAKYYQVYLKRTGRESNKGPERLKYINDQLINYTPRARDVTWFGGGGSETVTQKGGFAIALPILSIFGLGGATAGALYAKKAYETNVYARSKFLAIQDKFKALMRDKSVAATQIAQLQRDLLIDMIGTSAIKFELQKLSALNVEYDIIKDADATDKIKQLILFKGSFSSAEFYTNLDTKIMELISNQESAKETSKAISTIIEAMRTAFREKIQKNDANIETQERLINTYQQLPPEKQTDIEVIKETIKEIRAQNELFNTLITQINYMDIEVFQKMRNILSYSSAGIQQFRFPNTTELENTDRGMLKFRNAEWAGRINDVVPFIGNLYDLIQNKSGLLSTFGLIPTPPKISMPLSKEKIKSEINYKTVFALLQDRVSVDITNVPKDYEQFMIQFINYFERNEGEIKKFLYDTSKPEDITFWQLVDPNKVDAYYVHMDTRKVPTKDGEKEEKVITDPNATFNIYINSFDNIINANKFYQAYKKFVETSKKHFTTFITALRSPPVFNNVLLNELKETDTTMLQIAKFAIPKLDQNKEKEFKAMTLARFKEFLKNPEAFIPLFKRLWAVLSHPCDPQSDGKGPSKYVEALAKQAGKGNSQYILQNGKLTIKPGSSYTKAHDYMVLFLNNPLTFTLPIDYCKPLDIKVGPPAQRVRYQMDGITEMFDLTAESENDYVLDMSVQEFIALRQTINILYDSIKSRHDVYIKKYNEIDALKKKTNLSNIRLPALDSFTSATKDELKYLAAILYCIGRKAEVEFLAVRRPSQFSTNLSQTPKEAERAAYWANKLTDEQVGILETFSKFSFTVGSTYTTAELQRLSGLINLNKLNIMAPPYMFLTNKQRIFAWKFCKQRIKDLYYPDTIALIIQLLASYDMVGVSSTNMVDGKITKNITEMTPEDQSKLQSASLVMRYGAPVKNFYLSYPPKIYKTVQPIINTNRTAPIIVNDTPIAGNFKYELSKLYDRPDIKYNYESLLNEEERQRIEDEKLAEELDAYIESLAEEKIVKSILREDSTTPEFEVEATPVIEATPEAEMPEPNSPGNGSIATGGKQLVERVKNRSTRRSGLRYSSRTRKHVH